MTSRLPIVIFLILFSTCLCFAQADPSSVLPGGPDDERSRAARTLREQMEKMRIAKEKKDHEELLNRGQQALKLSEELEAAESLTSQDVAKIESLEKIVKKIRGDLGGRDDDSEEPTPEDDDSEPEAKSFLGVSDALKSLRRQTVRLVDELKKNTRFSISAAAIQSSNAVLNLTRFLRLRR